MFKGVPFLKTVANATCVSEVAGYVHYLCSVEDCGGGVAFAFIVTEVVDHVVHESEHVVLQKKIYI